MSRLPNIISFSRGIASIALLFPPVYGTLFLVLYAWCGISDMIDGPLARKLGAVSRKGAIIDSVSDIVFVAAAAFRLIPVFDIPSWIWLWIAGIAVIRILNIAVGYIRYKRLTLLHTRANRITGLLLFLLPVAIHVAGQTECAAIVCAAATIASVQEGIKILKKKHSIS